MDDPTKIDDRAEFEELCRRYYAATSAELDDDTKRMVWWFFQSARQSAVGVEEVRRLLDDIDKADEHATLGDRSQYMEIDAGLWGNVTCSAAALEAKIGEQR